MTPFGVRVFLQGSRQPSHTRPGSEWRAMHVSAQWPVDIIVMSAFDPIQTCIWPMRLTRVWTASNQHWPAFETPLTALTFVNFLTFRYFLHFWPVFHPFIFLFLFLYILTCYLLICLVSCEITEKKGRSRTGILSFLFVFWVWIILTFIFSKFLFLCIMLSMPFNIIILYLWKKYKNINVMIFLRINKLVLEHDYEFPTTDLLRVTLVFVKESWGIRIFLNIMRSTQVFNEILYKNSYFNLKSV